MKCPKCSGEMVYDDRVIKWYEYTSDCEIAWFHICEKCNIRIDRNGNVSPNIRIADEERYEKGKGEGMKRWSCVEHRVITNKKVDNFLKDIVQVCKKHNMCLIDDDGYFGFAVVNIERDRLDRIKNAVIDVREEECSKK